MSHQEDKEIEYKPISSKKVMTMLQVTELLVQTLNRKKGHKVIRSVIVYQYSTTYPTANRVMDSWEHRSKYHVRAAEDDILSKSKKKTDRSGISE